MKVVSSEDEDDKKWQSNEKIKAGEIYTRM